ncbi:MAG TPA: YceI family protein [Flavobacteriaceae bacterium]|nr:YceI family protein [Flavobacteriaceae bacterium]
MTFLLSLWIFGVSLFLPPQEPIEEFNVLPSSTLEIKGSSNVNTFTCVFDIEDISTVSVNYNSQSQKFESALVQFPVASFDCGGRMINSDFKELLQEKNYPKLSLRLVRIEPIEEDKALVSMEFEIAGVKNLYKMPVSFAVMKGYYSSRGHIELDIEDFGLTQPKKLFGMIVISNKIDVHFKFDFV